METLVRGKYVFTDAALGPAGVLTGAAVLVSGSEIAAVGPYEALRRDHPQAALLGGPDCMVLPGLIDAHTHGRGLSFLQRGPGYDFLENALLDWAFAVDLPAELNAPLTALRHLRNGCTTLHHNEMGKVSDPDALAKAETALRAYRQAGIRAAYSPGIRDENFLAYDDQAFFATLPPHLQEFARPLVFFDKVKAREDYFALFEQLYAKWNGGLTRIFFGPSWAQGASDEYLLRVKERADALGGLPVHIHTLQTPIQRAYGLRRHGKSLLMRLNDLGLVDEHLTLGHAVYVDQADIELLAEKGASVTHHPSCNFAMRNGIAPVVPMVRAGVNVALGIDEKAFNDDEDAIGELRMIFYIHRLSGFDLEDTPALDPYQVIAMGTRNAARCLGLGDEVGALRPGMKADLITLDMAEMTADPWASPDLDPGLLFIHRARGRHVRDVLVDGQAVVVDGAVQTIDVEALYREVRACAEKGLTPAQRAYAERMREIKPYVQRWYRSWADFPREPFYAVNSRK